MVLSASDRRITELFKNELLQCLDETFEHVHGIYLDKGTSLFETLSELSAHDVSRSTTTSGATIAAHVEHVRFYLDVVNEMMQKERIAKVDWRAIWQNVREVTPEEWERLKGRLRESHQRLMATVRGYERWDGDYGIAGCLAALAHTAYHLGAIRQAVKGLRG